MIDIFRKEDVTQEQLTDGCIVIDFYNFKREVDSIKDAPHLHLSKQDLIKFMDACRGMFQNIPDYSLKYGKPYCGYVAGYHIFSLEEKNND